MIGKAGLLGRRVASSLWSWGLNEYGRLGFSTDIYQQNFPTSVSSSAWNVVDGGDNYSLFVSSNGTVWACGYNFYGQLGNGQTGQTSTNSLIQIGSSTWQSVSAGGQHSLAIRSDGTLWAWGLNDNGQIGDGTNINRASPVQIGSAIWKKVSAGHRHSIAIRSDGTLWAWGRNGEGQIGDGTTTQRRTPVQVGTTTWESISAGRLNSLAISAAGTLWAWGYGNDGQLGNGRTVTIASPEQIGSATWKSVSAGFYHCMAIRSDGTLWAWGWNNYGEVGDGTVALRTTPVQVIPSGQGGPGTWKQCSAGRGHSTAIRSDGTLWAWGDNTYGQVGDYPAITTHASPVQIGASSWVSVNAGAYHSLGIQL